MYGSLLNIILANIALADAKVIITGLEFYTGTLEKTFTINKKEIIYTAIANDKEYDCSGKKNYTYNPMCQKIFPIG